MRNQEVIKGLRLIAEGISTIADAYEKDMPVKSPVEVVKPVEEPKVTTTTKAEKEDTNPTQSTPTKEETKIEIIEPVKGETKDDLAINEEELNKLSYNEVKVVAKELGLKAVGSKKVIIETILSSQNTQEPIEEVTQEELEIEEDDNEVMEVELTDEELAEDGELSLYDQIVADLEGYSDEELADILSDVGVSPKGKRQALLAKIVQAVEEGKLEWDDSEETTEDIKEPVEVEEVTQESEVEEGEEYEIKGSSTRYLAFHEEHEKVSTQIDKGEISHKEVMKFLKEYYNGKYVSQGQEADFDEYVIIQCELIDDEGDKHDLADPYYVGDNIYCCGKHLKELNNDLYCEICGQEYEL